VRNTRACGDVNRKNHPFSVRTNSYVVRRRARPVNKSMPFAGVSGGRAHRWGPGNPTQSRDRRAGASRDGAGPRPYGRRVARRVASIPKSPDSAVCDSTATGMTFGLRTAAVQARAGSRAIPLLSGRCRARYCVPRAVAHNPERWDLFAFRGRNWPLFAIVDTDQISHNNGGRLSDITQ